MSLIEMCLFSNGSKDSPPPFPILGIIIIGNLGLQFLRRHFGLHERLFNSGSARLIRLQGRMLGLEVVRSGFPNLVVLVVLVESCIFISLLVPSVC